MQYNLHAIRRVLTTAHRRISLTDFQQEVQLFVFANHRWDVEWGKSDCSFPWLGDVDHAMQQLADHGLEEMDSHELCRVMVTTAFGDELQTMSEGSYKYSFRSVHVAEALASIIELTPIDVSSDERVRDALIGLSKLEREFLLLLASRGDDVRVSNTEIASHCWTEAVDDDAIRNVYRGLQQKLRSNRGVQIFNARKGYKIELKN